MIIFIFFIVLFLVGFIFSAVVKNQEVKNKFGMIYAFVFVVFILSAIVVSSSLSNPSYEAVADGFTIEGYEVILDVGLDNKIEVTENINVHFYEEGHHGIFKFTPYWLEYTGKNNKTIKRKSEILNYRAIGDEYSLDVVNKKQRIKIGSPYQTVYGDKKYTIKYTYDMGKDPYSGFDEFIFHAFGDYWGTEIKNSKVIIYLPKNLDNMAINVFKDKYRQENVTNLVDIKKDGNTITIDGKNINLSKSLTIDLALPEGYFVGGSWNYGWISTIISIIVIIIAIYIIIIWTRYGKDHEKKYPTVEFYAPDDLDSAEIGYVYNKMQSTKKLTISLIIQLASKGYLKIDEIDGKIKVTKLHVKPKEFNTNDVAIPKRIIEIEKLKDADNSLSNTAKNKLNYFFKDGNTRKLEANIDAFLQVKDELVSGGYIKVLSDINPSLDEKIINEKMKKMKDMYEDGLKKYEEEMAKLPKKTALENIVYGNLFSVSDEVILSEHTSFYKTFSQISAELKKYFQKRVHDDVARKQKIKAFILCFITFGLSMVSFFAIEDMDPSWSILYYLAFICVPINLFFAFIMGRKTEYGEYISARVKGFRDFLLTAEKEKLEALVLENPHYFYDILPYTYVLNISKKWISKFENIKIPESDMGSFHYDSDMSFHSIMDNVYYPANSSSSSGGCGGGCSSCGGGCSSCGGGGSW